MLAAGLLARKAVALGLRPPRWVRTSLAPGSRAVTGYLAEAGLLEPLEALGFATVGYGCATCIGNSGPLPDDLVAGHQGGGAGGGGRAQRQPQLRGPHPSARCGPTIWPRRRWWWPTPWPARWTSI